MMPGLGSKVVARARPWARGAGAEGRGGRMGPEGHRREIEMEVMRKGPYLFLLVGNAQTAAVGSFCLSDRSPMYWMRSWMSFCVSLFLAQVGLLSCHCIWTFVATR